MSGQTIEVPRELLELAAKQLLFYGRELVAGELRALLDASPCEFHQSSDECKAYSGQSPCSEAAQPQGEPVACITLQQVLKAYDYANCHPHKYLRGTTNWCAAVVHSLNAEQPAPVASNPQCQSCQGRGSLKDADGMDKGYCGPCDGSGKASALSAAELRFLEAIALSPGCKLNGGIAWDEEGNSLWERLEALGLIECVGGYKWKLAFNAVELGVKAYLCRTRQTHANPPSGAEPSGTHHDNDGLDEMRK